MNKYLRKPTVHVAPWEKAFDRVLSPLDEFIHRQSTSSILLMVCAVIALLIANSPLGESYLHALHTPIAVQFGQHTFSLSLLHWINEALMAFFFLLVGLELKRELLVGELANFRQATLPIIAALGGMLVPAFLYWCWNPTGPAAHGWGIPMATDIAFAIGALSLLGNRVPKSLLMFLIALAIVDDLGAVLVIAIFYTEKFNLAAFSYMLLLASILVAFNIGGIRRLLPYLLIGALLWCAMLASGIHATLAGIVLAFTIPIRPKYNASHFIQEVRGLSQQMKKDLATNPDILHNDALRSRVIALEHGVELVQAPAQRLENQLHLPVAYLVIPLFALGNAAIHVASISISQFLTDPVLWGVVFGLIIGKWVGIAGTSWLAIHFGLASLPTGMRISHLHGIGLLGGIGFTMSIFVADLAFLGQTEMLLMAKTGILIGSLLAGLAGMLWLHYSSKHQATPADMTNRTSTH
jgi:NhaA family Na+:H+ antiporter